MSHFRAFMLNPNVHGIFALLLQIASIIPAAAPFAGVLATVAGVLTATTVLLPETGSLHATDYEKIAAVVAQGVADATKPGRA